MGVQSFERWHQNEFTLRSCARYQIIKRVNRVLSFCVHLNVSCSLQWRDQTEGQGWGGLGWCIPVINANWQWTPALQQKVAPSETSIWWPHTSRQTASSSVMAAPPWEGCQLRRLTHIGPGFPLMSGFSYSNPLLSVDCLLNHKSQADLWHSYTPAVFCDGVFYSSKEKNISRTWPEVNSDLNS